MDFQTKWGWFNNAPENICKNEIVADACLEEQALKCFLMTAILLK